ncbi:MAG: hypothetical protein EZS28_015945 [Streblomastix strix]|uniref:Uncharacterized protein n=1 Tax=Streblomastix strix TaxID=222440 RepID=A0A5J4W119_9EUKA|nr:MAG: hypothetical protein EZS28_015945 [Streblomastix strix]
MHRVGLKKIEVVRTSLGEKFSISAAFRKTSSAAFLKNPFDSMYVQIAHSTLKESLQPERTPETIPEELELATLSLQLRTKILREQMNSLSKQTQLAERKMELPSHNKDQNNKESVNHMIEVYEERFANMNDNESDNLFFNLGDCLNQFVSSSVSDLFYDRKYYTNSIDVNVQQEQEQEDENEYEKEIEIFWSQERGQKFSFARSMRIDQCGSVVPAVEQRGPLIETWNRESNKKNIPALELDLLVQQLIDEDGGKGLIQIAQSLPQFSIEDAIGADQAEIDNNIIDGENDHEDTENEDYNEECDNENNIEQSKDTNTNEIEIKNAINARHDGQSNEKLMKKDQHTLGTVDEALDSVKDDNIENQENDQFDDNGIDYFSDENESQKMLPPQIHKNEDLKIKENKNHKIEDKIIEQEEQRIEDIEDQRTQQATDQQEKEKEQKMIKDKENQTKKDIRKQQKAKREALEHE